MEQKETTTPQWIEDMQMWQKEDSEYRSVICVATDKDSVYSTLGGYSLPLVIALLANTIKREIYDEIVKGVFLAKNEPLAAEQLLETWKEFKKEHGYPMDEEGEPSDKPSINNFLKNLFQTLADKL